MWGGWGGFVGEGVLSNRFLLGKTNSAYSHFMGFQSMLSLPFNTISVVI